MDIREEAKAYLIRVLRHWWIIAFSVGLAIVGATQDILQSIWVGFVMPIWVWVLIIFIGFSIAQFLAWRDMKRERDLLRRYDVNQQTLSDLAKLRDRLISHQNVEITSGTHLGQWIEQFNATRKEVNEILEKRVSYAEHRAYDHIGLFVQYAAPRYPNLTDDEYAQFLNWRSRVARDHKWIEKFIHDYSRYRMRADLSAISGSEPMSETDTNGDR